MEHKLEYIKYCPICGSEKLINHSSPEDYFLSKEKYIIQKCEDCNFLFTNPRPTKEHIGLYYKSENYISHSNKSKGLFALLYKWARKLNLSYKYSIISKYYKYGTALDIGSGTGHFLNFLKNKNWKVAGIEPDIDAAKFSRDNFNLQINSEDKIKEFKNNSFDLITMWHVLEHVHNLNDRMAELRRLINPKGLVILALPNAESFDSIYYDKYWAAYDVPRHLYHFAKNDVSKLADKYNFRIEKVYPMRLDAFYVSILSEKYKHKRGQFFRAFLIAFISNCKSSTKNPNTSSLIYILRPIRA